ncbi:MAG: PaaI family thioesterase [Acidobacteriota bacterium]
MNEPAIPAGFKPHFKESRFTDPWEPLLSRVQDDQVQMGVLVRDAHCNSRGLVHGGFLAAIADNALGLSIGVVLKGKGLEVGSLVTTNLSIDYLGMAKVGEWLATDTEVLKAGRSLCTAQCRVATANTLVARVNATFLRRATNS